MPVPKRKHCHARSARRASQWKQKVPTLSRCAHCGQIIRAHRICHNCGYYGGIEFVTPPEE
ncbi:MAG: 50S ribosomal protein L32 [Elusimicrobiota bacterium]